MPKIPVAEGGGSGNFGIPDAPSSIRNYDTGADEFGKSLSQAATSFAQAVTVNEKLKQQGAELEFSGVKINYANREDAIKADLSKDAAVINNPESYADAYAERARALQEELRGGIKDSRVGMAFNRWLEGEYPKGLIAADKTRQTLVGQLRIAETDVQGESLAKMAAETNDNAKRQEYKDQHKGLVDGLFLKGYIKAGDHRDRLTKFDNKVLENNMLLLSHGDQQARYRMMDNLMAGVYGNLGPEVKLKYIEAAGKTALKEDAARVARVKQAKDSVENVYYGLANFGQMPAEELDSLARGDNPLFNAKEAKEIIDRNADPLLGGSVTPVNAVLSEMHQLPGPITAEKIENAREQLRQMLPHSGATKEITRALEKLTSLHSEARSVTAQETLAAYQYAETLHKTQIKTAPMPMLNNMLRNKSIMQMAEIRKIMIDEKIKTAEGAAEVVERVMGAKKDSIPDNRSDEDKAFDKLMER